MSIHLFGKKRKVKLKEHQEFDVRKYWVILLTLFTLLLSLEIAFFSWYFLKVSRMLDTPANSSLETNASKIESMLKGVGEVKQSINTRTGIEL